MNYLAGYSLSQLYYLSAQVLTTFSYNVPLSQDGVVPKTYPVQTWSGVQNDVKACETIFDYFHLGVLSASLWRLVLLGWKLCSLPHLVGVIHLIHPHGSHVYSLLHSFGRAVGDALLLGVEPLAILPESHCLSGLVTLHGHSLNGGWNYRIG